MALYANREYVRALTVTDAADAFAIGSGELTVPNDWIDMVAESDKERGRWRNRELRKGG